ncbi:MAG: phosphoadenosine phosphosulfate reductase family protein [Armatimonadia bacterium]
MYMSWADLQREQQRDLDYKIERAVEAIRQAAAVSRHQPALAFSGGKDSTVLWDIIRRYCPELAARLLTLFGNTTLEYPESLRFARHLGGEWAPGRFYEATPPHTAQPGLKYEAQRQVLEYLVSTGQISAVLKADGRLKTTRTLERACPPEMLAGFQRRRLVWPAGQQMNFWWSADQYGFPILGKARSRLVARRINIDCFLRFSQSQSTDAKLLAYYRLLSQVRFSNACCKVLKKQPSEELQARLDVDLIFKGLMASESRPRRTNFITRGYLFRSHRKHLGDDPFWHCQPLGIWTDADIWEYIRRFDVPYSPLYDMGWTGTDGQRHTIKRNGCMACATDILFKHNHMSMLRHTHPRHWRVFMEHGMAAEIQRLQAALRRRGQLSLFDVMDVRYLMDNRPCIFDSITELVLDDTALADPGTADFDPEVE